MSQTDADHAAAEAVVAHHAELSAALTRHVTSLRAAALSSTMPDPADVAEGQTNPGWREHRQALVTWLRTELLPHATAEEGALYPPAAAQDAGRLLVAGMLAEHQAIAGLVTQLEAAGTAVDAAATAHSIASVFQVHLGKENNLVLPLLLATDTVSPAAILDGMHDQLGAPPAAAPSAAGHSGCGCGGDHGDADAAAVAAPVLTVDSRLDVRTLPHAQRHPKVLAAISDLPAGGALVLIAPHAPLPLLAEIDHRFPGQIDSEWLQQGPGVWQIRLHRQFAGAPHPAPGERAIPSKAVGS